MAELNFNALTPQGPRGFMQGFTQGQTEQVAMEANQLKLQELKRDRDEMMQLQEQLKGMGQDPDLDKFLDAYIATGRPEYVKMGIEGKQKLKEQRAYANLIGGAPAAAPVNAMAPAAPVVAPVNAMAQPAPAAAAPVNALAQPAVAETRKRISDLMTFAAQNPNMAGQAMSQARLLQDQLEMDSRRGPATPAPPALVQEYEYAKQQGYKGSLFDFKRELASAGQPVTNVQVPVNVSTEKKYGEAFGGKMAEADIGKLTAAEKAPQLAESANRIVDLVAQGNVFTGPAADIKLNIARALNVAGANNQEKIANTESLIAASGQSTLDAIKSAGLGTGQGFTDKDLKFLQGIAGGTINLTSQTLTELAKLQHRAATRTAESWNKRVQEMPKEVLQGTGLSTTPIKVPELKSGAAANIVVTPDGQSHRFPTPAAAAQFKKAAGIQ